MNSRRGSLVRTLALLALSLVTVSTPSWAGRSAAPAARVTHARQVARAKKLATTRKVAPPRRVAAPASRAVVPTRKVAGLEGPFARRPSGLLVPVPKTLAVPAPRKLVSVRQFGKQQRLGARWRGAKRSALGQLHGEGTRLAPAGYQKLLRKLFRDAEEVLVTQGATVSDFEPMVIDGPPGTTGHGINAGAWTGGLFTMNKTTIDFAYLIADAYAAAGSEAEVHINLARVGEWQRSTDSGKPMARPTFRTTNRTFRNEIAEGILGFVVNHEIGHALLDHVALGDPDKLSLPETKIQTPPFNVESRQHEADADAFSTKVGLAGAVKYKQAMLLLPLYWHLESPAWDANEPLSRGREDRSHPVSKDRFNDVRAELEKAGVDLKAAKIPEALSRDKLWIPESARRTAKPAAPASR